MPKKKIFLIMGRTSSGKTEITKGACEQLGLKQVMSFTTRPLRDNEKKSLNARDHYFIQPEEVDHYRDQMAAYTKIGDYEYFATFEELDKSDCYVIDPIGAEDLMNNCGDKYDFVTIYVRRPIAEMKKAYNSRSKKGDTFRERYDAEDAEFTQYEKANKWDYHILNIDGIEDSIAKMVRIIKTENHKTEQDKKKAGDGT